MLMVPQASKLNFPGSHPSQEVLVTSLLFEPFSHSLALMRSDSSILLFPSFSIFSSSPSPSPSPPSSSAPTQTLIPPLSTSACFLHLNSKPTSPDGRVVFVVAGPNSGGSRVLLRFWVLKKNKEFAKARVNCCQNGLDDSNLGLSVDLSHGLSVKLVGAGNYFALHSVSAKKVWVFGAKLVGDGNDDDENLSLNLVKCAVIDCTIPICSITVSLGFMILGEKTGVRVFPLRPLVKGRAKKPRESGRRRENNSENGGLTSDVLKNRRTNLPNGLIRVTNGSNELYQSSLIRSKYGVSNNNGKGTVFDGTTENPSNGFPRKAVLDRDSAKPRAAKLRQDSGLSGSFFVAFKSMDIQNQNLKEVKLNPPKPVSVQALSHKMFLILDSVGDLHLLSISGTSGSEFSGHMRRLSRTMKVQMLAVLPDISSKTQAFWTSDGFHTIHTMSIFDMDVPANDEDKQGHDEKLTQISASQAVFTNEKIQELIPVSANAVLVLGQGNIYAYAISGS